MTRNVPQHWGRRINIAAGNLPLVRSHPTGIELRSEVHRDWISFDLSRAAVASFSGDIELRQRPATAKRKARSSGSYQPGAIHGDRAIQRTTFAGATYQQ